MFPEDNGNATGVNTEGHVRMVTVVMVKSRKSLMKSMRG